ncbi:hypothetical protein LguiB_003812 [Lonicera macranthoides]
MGGSICGNQSQQTWYLLLENHGWNGAHEAMEHRAPQEILSLTEVLCNLVMTCSEEKYMKFYFGIPLFTRSKTLTRRSEIR